MIKLGYLFQAITIFIFMTATAVFAETFDPPSPVYISGDLNGLISLKSDNPDSLNMITSAIQFHNDITKHNGEEQFRSSNCEVTRINKNLITIQLVQKRLKTQFAFSLKSGSKWGKVPSCKFIPDVKTVIIEESDDGNHFSLIAHLKDRALVKSIFYDGTNCSDILNSNYNSKPEQIVSADNFMTKNSSSLEANKLTSNNSWVKYNLSDTVFIFVHGIFSNSIDCWTAKDGTYWPALLSQDARFEQPSVYVAGYYTDFSSGIYRVNNAADEMLSYLKVRDIDGHPSPLEKQNIIFIAHSTGGLVVRYALERYHDLFVGKNVGLVLLASPSRGSEWANRLEWLRGVFKNKMAGELARDNDFIQDLDSRFSDFVQNKLIKHLVGIDAFENKFIVPGFFFNDTHVVSASDSGSYFGAYRIVPNTDHFSIAKPTSLTHPSHQLLYEFYETRFKPATMLPNENLAAKPDEMPLGGVGANEPSVASIPTSDTFVSEVGTKYSTKSGNSEADLEIKRISDKWSINGEQVHVHGIALYGTNPTLHPGPPHIGELDFVAKIENGNIQYSQDLGEGRLYKIQLKCAGEILEVTEEYIPEYAPVMFGLNVSFSGSYKKVGTIKEIKPL